MATKTPTKRRNADYKLLEALKAFVPCMDPEARYGTSGNIQNAVSGTCDYSENVFTYKGGILKKPFYDAVSAPMLLARVCSGFEGLKIEVEGQPGCKVTWFTALVHPESGHVVTFYDWKGAASVGSDVSVPEGQFKKDFAALIKALANPRFPHPYDGCVVGEVA